MSAIYQEIAEANKNPGCITQRSKTSVLVQRKTGSSTIESVANVGLVSEVVRNNNNYNENILQINNKITTELRIKQLWNILRSSTRSHRVVDFVNVESKKNVANADLFVENIRPIGEQILKKKQTIYPSSSTILKVLWKYKPTWDIVTSILILYYIIILPYRMAFHLYEKYTAYKDELCIDIFFFLDSIYSFGINIDIIKTEENLAKIRITDILTTWNIARLLISILACLPFVYIEPELILIKFLFRLIDITKVIMLFDKLVDYLKVNWINSMGIVSILVTLVKGMTLFFIVSHIFACGWILIGNNQNFDSWISRAEYTEFDNFSIYIDSFFFTIVTFSTVGYGNLLPKRFEEYSFAMIYMFTGIVLYGYIRMNIIHVVEKINQMQRSLNEAVDDVRSWLININKSNPGPTNINLALWEEIKNIISFKQSENFTEIFANNKIFLNLSFKLQFRLIEVLFGEYLNYFNLKYLNREFIMILILRLIPKIYTGNYCLISKNKKTPAIYFIRSGIIVKKLHKQGPILQTFQGNEVIGEDLFASEKKSDYYYMVDNDSSINCMVLSIKHFSHLQELFPHDVQILKNIWKRKNYLSSNNPLSYEKFIKGLPGYANNIRTIIPFDDKKINRLKIKKNNSRHVSFVSQNHSLFCNTQANNINLENSLIPLVNNKLECNENTATTFNNNNHHSIISPLGNDDYSSNIINSNPSPSCIELLPKKQFEENINDYIEEEQGAHEKTNNLDIRIGYIKKKISKNENIFENESNIELDQNPNKIIKELVKKKYDTAIFEEIELGYTINPDKTAHHSNDTIYKVEDIMFTLNDDSNQENRYIINETINVLTKSLKTKHIFNHVKKTNNDDTKITLNLDALTKETYGIDLYNDHHHPIDTSDKKIGNDVSIDHIDNNSKVIQVSDSHLEKQDLIINHETENEFTSLNDHDDDEDEDHNNYDDDESMKEEPEYDQGYQELYKRKHMFKSEKNLDRSIEIDSDLSELKYELIQNNISKINQYLKAKYVHLYQRYRFLQHRIEFCWLDLSKDLKHINKKFKDRLPK